MANLLDDLKGILSPEEYAKIDGNRCAQDESGESD